MIHIGAQTHGDCERPRHRNGENWDAGFECMHVCLKDACRIALAQTHPNEKAQSAIAHLRAAIAVT